MVDEANTVESEIWWMIICFIGWQIWVLCLGIRNREGVVYESGIGTRVELHMVSDLCFVGFCSKNLCLIYK